MKTCDCPTEERQWNDEDNGWGCDNCGRPIPEEDRQRFLTVELYSEKFSDHIASTLESAKDTAWQHSGHDREAPLDPILHTVEGLYGRAICIEALALHTGDHHTARLAEAVKSKLREVVVAVANVEAGIELERSEPELHEAYYANLNLPPGLDP